MRVVEQVLERRRSRSRGQSRLATAAALLLHAAFLGAILLGPRLHTEEKPPMRFVTAQIVPLQALGQPDPPPPEPPPRQEPPPPEPQPPAETQAPPPPEPQPAPPPVDPEIPTLPEPTEEPRRTAPPPEPQPAPVPQSPPPVRQGSDKGNARGTAAFGAAVASLDNPDFTYSYYLDRMVALIRARWKRPSAAEGTESAVHFRVLTDGSITEVELRRPSGDTLFDRAALRAIQDASPLPPLPVGYRQESLGVSLIVR